MRFTITSEYAKVRLDKFLTEHFPEMSRAHLQRLVKSGQVLVNGNPVTPHHFLRLNDEVEATVEPTAELLVVPNAEVKVMENGEWRMENGIPSPPTPPRGLRPLGPSSTPAGEGDRRSGEGIVRVLHEEPDFIVLNKPAGLVVHQGAGHKTPDTLVNGLLARYPEIARVGDDTIRPGIVHRLDADVSGVMVIARTQDMFEALKRQFKMHMVEKEYVAVVYGAVSPASGVIEFAIARKGAKMVARAKGEEGKAAVTEYETISHSERSEESPTNVGSRIRAGSLAPLRRTVLKIKIHTGRTHQIRVHLFALGYPIVGDRLYGKEHRAKGTGQHQKFSSLRHKLYAATPRLLLHAHRLAFTDLKGARREFVAEPPRDFV